MENRKRSVLLIYGEETENISIRVPKSKKSELRDKFYEVLKGYEDPKTVLVDCVVSEQKPNPAKSAKVIPNSDTEFKTKAGLVIQPKTEDKRIYPEKTGYEIIDSVPLGSQMMEIIGHKCHKHHSEEIYYVKLSEGAGFKVVVLHSEKEVKDFIRKEIVK